MTRQVPLSAPFTLLLDCVRALIAHAECGYGGHDWVGNPENGSHICRCCLVERKG